MPDVFNNEQEQCTGSSGDLSPQLQQPLEEITMWWNSAKLVWIITVFTVCNCYFSITVHQGVHTFLDWGYCSNDQAKEI